MNNSISYVLFPRKMSFDSERIMALEVSFRVHANCEKKPNPHWINEDEMWYVQAYFGDFSANAGDWSAIWK